MENYHTKIAETLKTLLKELDGEQPAGINIGSVTYNKDSLTIELFPATFFKGWEIINNLLDNFKKTGIIVDKEYNLVNEEVINQGVEVNGGKCDLTLRYDPQKKNINITFNPRLNPQELYTHLINSVELVQRENGASCTKPATLVKEEDSLIQSDLSCEKMQIINQLEKLKSMNQCHGYMKSYYKDLEYSGNDEFVMRYLPTGNGKDEAISFLKKIISGGFLDKADPKIDISQLKNGTKLYLTNFDLETKIQDNLFHVVFKPKLSDDIVINNLERAINRAFSTEAPSERESPESFVKRMTLESTDKTASRTRNSLNR
ncbi:MAG: hypothetical protein AABY33_01575 [Pseudomonadota bacterium]